jgi:two-component system, LuxR family, response regulator FixJ
MRGLVLDLKLDGMSGLDLLERLRAAASPVPVILLTAHGDGDVQRRALELGAVAFLTKPFLPETLIQAVRAATRGPAS